MERRFLRYFRGGNAFSPDSIREGPESPGGESRLCGSPFQRPGGALVPFPEGIPADLAPGTQAVGQEEARHARHLVHPGHIRQGGHQGLVAPQRLVRRASLSHGIEQLQAVPPALQAGGKELQVGPLSGRHVIDVLHVAVERGATAEIGKDPCQHDYPQQHDAVRPSPARQAPPAERQALARTAHRPAPLQEHREADQHEQDGAHQGQRAEPAQVAHGLGIQQHQAEEGTDSRDVARQQGRHHLFQCLAHVRLMLQVLHEMQRIVDRNADDDRSDANDYQRQTVPQQGHCPQGEKPSCQDRHAYPPQVARTAEGIEQHGQDEHHRQGHGQQAVPLDLRGIGDGYQRRADGRHPHLRASRPRIGHAGIQQGLQAGVVARLADAEGRFQQGNARAVPEEVAVHHLVRLVHIQSPEAGQQGRGQLQGVVGQSLRQQAACGEHQQQLVPLHLRGQVTIVRQQRIQALVIVFRQQGRIVPPQLPHHVHHGRLVHPDLQVAHPSGRVAPGHGRAECVHRLLHLLPVLRPALEYDGYLVLPAQAGEHLRILPGLLVQGHEGGNVLVIVHAESQHGT